MRRAAVGVIVVLLSLAGLQVAGFVFADSSSGPADVDARPDQCVTIIEIQNAANHRGSPTPRDAAVGAHPRYASDLTERVVEPGRRVALERYEGDRRVIAFDVEYWNGGWGVTRVLGVGPQDHPPCTKGAFGGELEDPSTGVEDPDVPRE